MAKEKIYREDVLDMPLKFRVTGKHDAELVASTLKAVMDYVKNIPAVEDEKPVTRRPARKKT